MSRISISAQIPRLLNELNRPDVVGKKDLIADYVVEAIRLIGTYHDLDYVERVKYDVENHWAKLPATVFDIENVDYCQFPSSWSCNCNNTPCICYKQYLKSKLTDWKLDGCNLWVPVKNGVVYVDFWSMSLDKNGLPMVYEGTGMAARAYLRYVFSESLFEEGKITQGVFDRRKARWDELCTIARGEQLVPTREALAYAGKINNDPIKFRRNYGRR